MDSHQIRSSAIKRNKQKRQFYLSSSAAAAAALVNGISPEDFIYIRCRLQAATLVLRSLRFTLKYFHINIFVYTGNGSARLKLSVKRQTTKRSATKIHFRIDRNLFTLVSARWNCTFTFVSFVVCWRLKRTAPIRLPWFPFHSLFFLLLRVDLLNTS